jgi:hypothetical protein
MKEEGCGGRLGFLSGEPVKGASAEQSLRVAWKNPESAGLTQRKRQLTR